jgi:hypothetical protein
MRRKRTLNRIADPQCGPLGSHLANHRHAAGPRFLRSGGHGTNVAGLSPSHRNDDAPLCRTPAYGQRSAKSPGSVSQP